MLARIPVIFSPLGGLQQLDSEALICPLSSWGATGGDHALL